MEPIIRTGCWAATTSSASGTAEEQIKFDSLVEFLDNEISGIHSLHGAVPVPVIEWPEDGDYVSGPIELLVTHLYPAAEVDGMISEYRDPVSGDWFPLPVPPTNPEPGEWLQEIDTTSLPDGFYEVLVTLIDENVLPTPEDDRMCQAVVALRIDNTSPTAPTVTTPVAGPPVGGILHVEATSVPGEAFVACVEISTDEGVTWFETQTDYDDSDGWSFDISLLELPGGPYELRVTCMDEAENMASSLPVPVEVLPGYLPWRQGLNIPDDDSDEDRDGIPAIFEYYAGLDPNVYDLPSLLDYGIENNSGLMLLHCRRSENVFGLSATVEASSDLGINDPWAPLQLDPPREASGRIEVPLPSGDRHFGRLLLKP